jgi:hypothetical protein
MIIKACGAKMDNRKSRIAILAFSIVYSLAGWEAKEWMRLELSKNARILGMRR